MKTWLHNVREALWAVWRLRPHVRGGRVLVFTVILTSIAAACLEGVGVGMLVPLLGLLKGGEEAMRMTPIRRLQEVLPDRSLAFYVAVICGLILAAITAKNAALYGSQLLAARLRKRISCNLRSSLFSRLQGADLQLFEQRTGGELANIFFHETNRTFSLVDYLILLIQRLGMAAFYLGMLCYFSWQLTLLTLALASIIGASIMFISRHLAQSGKEIAELNQKMSTLVVESFAGVRVIRATNAEGDAIRHFNALNQEHGDVEERVVRTGLLANPLAEVIAVAGSMIIVASAFIFFVKPGAMGSNHLMVYGFVLLRLLPLVNQIYGLQNHVIYLSGGVKEVEKWLDSPQHPSRPFGHETFDHLTKGIEFDRVGYAYPNGTRALDDVSFDLPAGKTVALVGASGSGKSTIVSMLLRFRDVSSGQIRVDGRDSWAYTSASWHKRVAVVEQEAFLFHDTMKKNIAYGFPDVSEEAIRRAVRIANLEDMVKALPEGLETVVGERGTMLSGGQRQRLAIARAIVRDPQILILDEATSALDTISERQVQGALEEAMKGRTVLVIAHRLSTVRNADRIVVLEAGRVVQKGTWQELASAPGVFGRLLQLNAIRS